MIMMNFYIFQIVIITLVASFIMSEPPSRIIIGTTNKLIEINNECEQFEILTNYKHIAINISNSKNLDKILITDKLIDDCSSTNFAQCRNEANICQVRTVIPRSETNFETKMCVSSIYFMARKSANPSPDADGRIKFSFNISSSYVTGGSCTYIHENSFAYCGESNLEECRNCKKPGCTVIECGNEIKNESDKNNKYTPLSGGPGTNFNKMYELCIPYNVSDKEKLNKCISFNEVTTYKSTGNCEYDDLEGYSSLTVFLLGILVFFVLVFSISLIKNGVVAFAVPNFLPEFLFPRVGGSSAKLRTTIDNTLDDVFTRDNRQNF